MKFSKFLSSIVLSFIVLLTAFPVCSFAEGMGFARLSLVQGDVQISNPDIPEWTLVSVNMPLAEGDRLWIPEDGRGEMQFRGGVYIRADEQTAVDILSLSADSVQFYLDRGHLYINNRRGGIKTVQIETPLASIRSYDNSIIMIDVSEDGVTEASALKGDVYAETRAGATRIGSGNTLTIRGDNSAELSPIGPPDEWERWNVDRDRIVTAWSESSRYLPDDLHEYSSDFDNNGRWEYVGDYGYVWNPTVVSVDWAPYTVGRWIWVRGNYVWVSYEPWGWVPFHYGRWGFVTSLGWCWVPPAPGAVYWAPGYVGWIVTPTYVAWVPLAPGEIYYGYGYYGPGSVNITTVNINTVVVNRVYRNSTLTRAVTVVRRDTFGTGLRVPVSVQENPFVRVPRGKIGIVPPSVKPERRVPLTSSPAVKIESRQPPGPEQARPEELMRRRTVPAGPPEAEQERPALMPFIGRAPEKQQPPEQIRKIRPEEMKTERKLVRERNASAFKPSPAENLQIKQMKAPKVIIRKPVPPAVGQPQNKNLREKQPGPLKQRRD